MDRTESFEVEVHSSVRPGSLCSLLAHIPSERFRRGPPEAEGDFGEVRCRVGGSDGEEDSEIWGMPVPVLGEGPSVRPGYCVSSGGHGLLDDP